MTRDDMMTNTVITPVLLVVIVGLILGLGARHFVRLDLTTDGDFSLEPVTLQLLAEIPDQLTIRVYFTRDLEPPYHNLEGVVADLLDEYRARNPARIDVQWVDPTDDPALKEEARRMGLEPATLEVTAEGRREAREIWMGMAFVYRDRIDALPTVQRLDDLEFQVTRRIRAVVHERPLPVVGFLSGHGEPDVAEGTNALQTVRDKIVETYQVRKVELGDLDSVPDDVDVLVVLGAREPLNDGERLAFDQFLMSGRPALVFRSNLTPDARTRELHRSSDNLGDLLEHYGVAMETTIVADRFTNGLMPVPTRRGQSGRVNHPLIPLASDLDRDQSITRGVDTLAMPLTSPLTVVAEPSGCVDCTVHELVRTGKRSVALSRVSSLDPADYIKPVQGERPGPFLVAAALEGELRSFFTVDADGDAVDPASPPETRMVVVGSADYALKNLGFFLNALDWVSLDADMLSLRPDQSLPPVMQPLGRTTMQLVRLLNLGLVPALIAMAAVLRARRRRSR